MPGPMGVFLSAPWGRHVPGGGSGTPPPTGTHTNHYRVRRDRISQGSVSLRVGGHLHHIGIGRNLDGTRVILLIDHLDVRVIHATTDELIRSLTINPEHRYHGTGIPIGGPRRPYGPRKTNRPKPQ